MTNKDHKKQKVCFRGTNKGRIKIYKDILTNLPESAKEVDCVKILKTKFPLPIKIGERVNYLSKQSKYFCQS